MDELERDEERIHRLGSWEVSSRYNREGKSDTEGNRERERHRQRDDGSLVMKRRTTALHPDTPRLVQR